MACLSVPIPPPPSLPIFAAIGVFSSSRSLMLASVPLFLLILAPYSQLWLLLATFALLLLFGPTHQLAPFSGKQLTTQGVENESGGTEAYVITFGSFITENDLSAETEGRHAVDQPQVTVVDETGPVVEGETEGRHTVDQPQATVVDETDPVVEGEVGGDGGAHAWRDGLAHQNPFEPLFASEGLGNEEGPRRSRGGAWRRSSTFASVGLCGGNGQGHRGTTRFSWAELSGGSGQG